MKFKSDIEVQAGLRDGGNDIGTAGQILSSTGKETYLLKGLVLQK